MAKKEINHPIRHLTAVALLGLALGQAELVSASSFAVSPVSVSLSRTKPSGLVTLTNEGDEDVTVEVSVFSWTEPATGEMGLEPSEAILAFPPLASIPAHGERKVRIGLGDRTPVDVERTYRVFMEELPSSEAAAEPGKVKIRSRFGIPVFVQPAKPAGSAVLEIEGVRRGGLRFSIGNPGNAHVRLQAVSVTGLGASSEALFTRQLRAWYLLAGGLRRYQVALAPSECGAARSLLIEIKSEAGTVTRSVDSPATGCSP